MVITFIGRWFARMKLPCAQGLRKTANERCSASPALRTCFPKPLGTRTFCLRSRVILVLTFVLGSHLPLMALNESSRADLAILEDSLRYQIRKNPGVLEEWLPALVAPPQPYWQKSKSDFQAAALKMLQNVFVQNQRDLLLCSECLQQRTFVNQDGQLTMNSGELNSLDLHHLKNQPHYAKARALIILRETATGIDARIISLSHGELLFSQLADHTQSLDQVEQPLRLAQELERRQSGRALNYVFINWGLQPEPLFQFEFLEQWGARNQNLSGFVLSLVGPVGAIGGTYHYLLPVHRRLNFSGAAFLTLEGLTKTSTGSSSSPWGFVSQGMVQYAISGNYAVFASINTKGTFSIGFSFLNPVLFPFLL